MARSIHTTRRDREEILRCDYRNRSDRGWQLSRTRRELRRKRAIKDQVGEERRAPPPGPPVDPSVVPIAVIDGGEYVHHAVTVDDVRAMIARLPPGTATGVTSITLSLAIDAQGFVDHDDPVDPYTGRAGAELLPGVHAGNVLGCYAPGDATIVIGAFVYSPALAWREHKQLLLKLHALATVVHELAHHHDQATRVARGRWLADGGAKSERYAERMEHAWVQTVVVPYVEATYPADVAALLDWIEARLGCRLPLTSLVEDPRSTRPDGSDDWPGRTREAIAALFREAEAGVDDTAIRLAVARELHDEGLYPLARAVLSAIDRAHVEATIQLAHLDNHDRDYAAAEARARDALARAPDHTYAWTVLVAALRGQERWSDVVDAATRGIPGANAGRDRRWLASLVYWRMWALLQLADHAAIEHDARGIALADTWARPGALGVYGWSLVAQRRSTEALTVVTAVLATLDPDDDRRDYLDQLRAHVEPA